MDCSSTGKRTIHLSSTLRPFVPTESPQSLSHRPPFFVTTWGQEQLESPHKENEDAPTFLLSITHPYHLLPNLNLRQVGPFIEIQLVSGCLPVASQAPFGSSFEGHTSRSMAHLYLITVQGHQGMSCRSRYFLVAFRCPGKLRKVPNDLGDCGHAWRLVKMMTRQLLVNRAMTGAFANYREHVLGTMATLPFWVTEGHEIDPKEEAKRVERDVIIQRLYQGCKGTEVWNKSNSFIINRMTHEGAKWASRRLIDTEASTYLSHKWASIAFKVAAGLTYVWALWFAKKLKDQCRVSQMAGCPFPMPSLVAVICMEALGPPNWINPISHPRLNLYSRFRVKEERDLKAFRLQARGVAEQTEEAKGSEEQDQGASQSHKTPIGVVVTIPPMIHPLTSLSPTFSQSTSQDLLLSDWSQNLPGTEQALELLEDLVPLLKLKKVREKRKGRFNPSVRIIDGVLSTKSVGRLISNTTQELTYRVQELKLELILQADQLQKERAQIRDSLASSAKELEFSEMKSNYDTLQLRCGELERDFKIRRRSWKAFKKKLSRKTRILPTTSKKFIGNEASSSKARSPVREENMDKYGSISSPLSFPHPSQKFPPIQCDSPLSENEKDEQEKDSPLPTIEDVSTSTSIPKASTLREKTHLL
eukprot:Gb_00352 [translate_table: standard]